MKKIICLSVLFFCTFFLILAQDLGSDDNPSSNENNKTESGIEVLNFKAIRRGDKYMKLGIGVGVPLFNTSNKKFAVLPRLYPGPRIFLGMHFYVTDGLSLGADLSFEFYTSIAKNLLFILPVQFTLAYTPTYKRWRFPVGIGIGGAFMSYLGSKAFGLYINPFASFYYQYSPEWSFGGELNWAITTEFRKKKAYSRANNNVGISFSVRYHY